MTRPQAPRFTREISFGQIVQIVVLVFGIGAGWTIVKQQGAANSTALAVADDERAALELRVRALEISQAQFSQQIEALRDDVSWIRRGIEQIQTDMKELRR